jgi:hypothetical protein
MKNNPFTNLLIIAILLLGATVTSKGTWNYAAALKEIKSGSDKTTTLNKYGFTDDNPGPIAYIKSAIIF